VPTHGYQRRDKRRLDDDELTFAQRGRHRARLPAEDAFDATDGLPAGDRWSTWDQSPPTQRGPQPYPGWLVTELAAVDTELGIVKTGKEADVFLVCRAVPETHRSCLLAAKRYRAAEHRMFQRDSAEAEFAALRQLSGPAQPVPYPVQVLGTELLMEFIGDPDGSSAPRLAETRPDPASLRALWDQLVTALGTLARLGLAHGDLSAFNLLVHRGRLLMIDMPQVVDVIANPRGGEFLDRDAANISRWFAARGLTGCDPGPADLAAALRADAGLSAA